MRVFPDQLFQQLSPARPVYLIFGDDPWLTDFCKQQILHATQKQGFSERIVFDTQDSQFSWAQVQQECQAMSLFASKRIIEVQMPNGKAGVEGSAVLTELMAQPDPDIVLLLIGGKLPADQSKSKWFKALDHQGIFVPCATPEGAQFQRWLRGRIQFWKLALEKDAEDLLSSLYEGNLLAAEQALQLLNLLSPQQRISAQQLTLYFEDQSRFSVYQLTDALLVNHKKRALHMLSQLQAEATAMPIILWAIFKELSSLYTLKTAQSQQQPLNKLWASLRIWDKRQPLYQQALNRLTLVQIEAIMSYASQLERQLKQQGQDNWVGLAHLCLMFDPSAQHKLQSFIES